MSQRNGERVLDFQKNDKFKIKASPPLQGKVKMKLPNSFEEVVQYARTKDRKLRYQNKLARESQEGALASTMMVERELSPIHFVTSDDAPALIVHGEEDPAVAVSHGESMYQVLQEAGVESKFVAIPGAGHGFVGEDAELALSESVSWFEQHLVNK